LAGTSEKQNDKMVDELQKHFKLRDFGATKYLLGIAITCDWKECWKWCLHSCLIWLEELVCSAADVV
jgi:hypothetical protein